MAFRDIVAIWMNERMNQISKWMTENGTVKQPKRLHEWSRNSLGQACKARIHWARGARLIPDQRRLMEARSQLARLCALTLGCCHTNARSSSSPYVFIYHKRGLPQCSHGPHVPHTVFPCWCQALGGRCSVTRQRGHHPAQSPTHPLTPLSLFPTTLNPASVWLQTCQQGSVKSVHSSGSLFILIFLCLPLEAYG